MSRSTSKRHRLGTWTCPSGNNVIAYFRRDPKVPQVPLLELEWDTPPPLAAADELYYQVEIVPAIDRLVREFTETAGGSTLWVRS